MFRYLVLLLAFSCAVSFTVRPKSTYSIGSRVSSLASSRDEEIAKLEEQLRKLKEEESSKPDESEALTQEEKKYVANERVLEGVKGKDMLLSERELVDAGLLEEENTGGVGFGNIVAVVAAVVLLLVFAQIPVGQEDLSRYSATGSAGTTSIDLGDLNPDRKAISP